MKKRRILTGNLKSEMSKLKINPFLTHWILSAVNGESPKLERVTPLRLEQRVRLAFDGQNMIGWSNLAKGRTTQRMVAIQKWWDDEHQETNLQTGTLGQ